MAEDSQRPVRLRELRRDVAVMLDRSIREHGGWTDEPAWVDPDSAIPKGGARGGNMPLPEPHVR